MPTSPYEIKNVSTVNTATCRVSDDGTCEITGGDCKTKWLDFKDALYVDKEGNDKHWQYISRLGTNGVVTMACHDDQGRFAVIEEPRVPIDGKVNWSFPAGLIDHGESIEDAAIREMKEETGYDITVNSFSTMLSKSAGLTDETSSFVDCTLGSTGKTNLEETEDINVHLMTPDDVIALGSAIDPARETIANDLWTYMAGVLTVKPFLDKCEEILKS